MAVATIFKLVNNTIFIMQNDHCGGFVYNRTKYEDKGDAAIAMLSVSALAVVGYLMNIFSTSANVSRCLFNAIWFYNDSTLTEGSD